MPSTRDTIYYRDWTEPVNGWRYRLEILPSNTYTPQAGTPVSLPLATLPPDFAGTPAGGSIYAQLGPFAIEKTTVTAASFAGLPIGLPSPPTMKVGLNLTALNRDGFSDLVGYLLDPVTPSGGENLYAGTVYSYQMYDITTLFTLLTDKGDSGLSVANFAVEFMGCQQSNGPTTIHAWKTANVAVMEVECVHIARAAMEAVPITLVAARCISDHIANGYPNNGDRSTGVLYDYLYNASSRTYGRAHARWKSDDGHYEKARLFFLQQLQESCQLLMTDTFRGFQRLHPSSPGVAGFYSNNTDDPSYSASYKFCSPLDLVVFYRHDYTPANGTGTDLQCGNNATSDMGNLVLFNGLTWPSNKTNPTAATAETTCIGGFFIEADKDSIYRFPTLYDFQTKWAAGCYCKGAYTLSDRSTLKVWYNLVGTNLGASVKQLRAGDIIKQGAGSEECTIEIGAEALSGTAVNVPGMGNEDSASYTYKFRGASPDPDRALDMMFHASATIGDAANRYQMNNGDTSDLGYNPDITGDMVLGASTGFPALNLYYIDRPSFSGSDIAIKVHDQVGIRHKVAGSVYIDGEAYPLPTDTSSATDIRADFDGKYWNALRNHIKRAQKLSSLPYAIARRIATVFGSRRQVKYTTTLHLSKATLADLGDSYVMIDDNNVASGGGVFLHASESYLGTLPGAPYLTSIEPDYHAGTAKVTLLSPP